MGSVLLFEKTAEIAEYQERGPLRQGDRVSVKYCTLSLCEQKVKKIMDLPAG